MTIANYLERVDRGENITVSDMLREGADEEILELLDNGKVNGAQIQVSRSYANDQMYDKGAEDYLDIAAELFAEGISSLPRLENFYEDGFEQADRKMKEIDQKYSGSSKRNLIQKQAGNEDTKMKASEGLLAGGLGGFIFGNQIGSQGAMALSAAAAGLGAYGTPKTKGKKDRKVEEAAKGLEQAYGGYQLDIV